MYSINLKSLGRQRDCCRRNWKDDRKMISSNDCLTILVSMAITRLKPLITQFARLYLASLSYMTWIRNINLWMIGRKLVAPSVYNKVLDGGGCYFTWEFWKKMQRPVIAEASAARVSLTDMQITQEAKHLRLTYSHLIGTTMDITTTLVGSNCIDVNRGKTCLS